MEIYAVIQGNKFIRSWSNDFEEIRKVYDVLKNSEINIHLVKLGIKEYINVA